MFENIFKNELTVIGAGQSGFDRLWLEIKTSYSKPYRYYHNLVHLDNLIEQLVSVKDQISCWQTLVFSVAYHDIIYNARKKDNEEKSAELAFDRLGDLSVPEMQKVKCKAQILATKTHLLSPDRDTNFFTDADLSILGSDRNMYLDYTRQIRQEYKFYPDFLYKPGRRKVLEHFLTMESIFKTQYFRDKLENQAKANILSELKSL